MRLLYRVQPGVRPARSARMLDEVDVEEVLRRLAAAHPGRSPGAKGPKGQPDAFRSCIACMLSAQSLDRNTAAATRNLFALARTPRAMLALDEERMVQAIRPCGLYNMKARNIRAFCAALLERHGGTVPDTREGLMALPGIGRKCADIVLSFTFGHDVIAVDTHVHRVANRIGLADARTADATAQQLDQHIPVWAKRDGHFWLIQHGKTICVARRPRCSICPVRDLCLWLQTGGAAAAGQAGINNG
ncbi:endonuclease III [Porphyrobacter sp. GA68]|uniref:endonuclease III domain-containing protein n=1 Tax=Porphyrobacter sp. GA68 TaxID=2883480 RepID=UPI001D182876|nr:endonuclease III [Porphyrobacter sp. GA68]